MTQYSDITGHNKQNLLMSKLGKMHVVTLAFLCVHYTRSLFVLPTALWTFCAGLKLYKNTPTKYIT